MPGGSAIAQPPVAAWEKCFATDPDLKIAGCSAVIRAGEDSPENLATAYNARGNGYLAKRRYDLAIEDFTQAIRLNPIDAGGFNNRGLVYAGKGDHQRAILDFDMAIRLNPNYARAFINRARSWLALGDTRRADTDIAKARQLHGDLPVPLE